MNISNLSITELEQLQKDIKNLLYYKQNIEPIEHDFDNLFYRGFEYLVDEWMCYEEGTATRVNWFYDGKPLSFTNICHMSKHTYTKVYKIEYDGKVWCYAVGNYANVHEKECTLFPEDLIEMFPPKEDTGDFTLEDVLYILELLSGDSDVLEDEDLKEFLD